MIPIKKIKSFTLSELIIVLILTSIIVGIAFSVLQLVQKQLIGIKKNYAINLEYSKLKTVLWLDFNRYSNISFDLAKDKMILKNELNSETYIFSENYVLRNRDTFFIKIENKAFFFDGLQVKGERLDAIKLVTTKAFLNQELFVHKKNDATSYFK